MGIRVGLLQINVTDLDEAWNFYVEKLGLRGERSLGANKAFELILEGSPRLLVYPVKRKVERNYPNDTGAVIVFYTDDIATTVTEWKEHGVTFERIPWSNNVLGIARSPFGPFIAFRDPFGNVHELLEPARR